MGGAANLKSGGGAEPSGVDGRADARSRPPVRMHQIKHAVLDAGGGISIIPADNPAT